MRKNLLKICLLACIALFSVACSRSEKLRGNQFLIEGEVSGVEDGTELLLFRSNGHKHGGGRADSIATDTVRNGRFRFKGETVSNTDRLIIHCFPPEALIVWVTPKAKVNIIGKDKIQLLWDVKSSVPNQKEQNRYTEKSRDLIAEYTRLWFQIHFEVFPNRSAASSEEELRANSRARDSIFVLIRSLEEKEYFNDVAIMEQTNISDIWLDKMETIAHQLYLASNTSYPLTRIEEDFELRQKAEALYSRMSEDDKNTPIGKYITNQLFPPALVKIGDDMEDGDFLDVYGNTKRISDYSEPGKYLLLDFWFRACGSCIKSLPETKEISETYRNKLTIISINVADNDDNWKKAMTEHDMPWVNIRDPRGFAGLAADYGVAGAPNYVLISPEGKVVDKWAGFTTGYLKQKVGENIK